MGMELSAEVEAPTGAVPAQARLALVEALEASERFHRDTRLGGILHGGKISFREKTPTDSLHIVIDGDRVSAHVDEICPLHIAPDGAVRYSLGKVLAHNLFVALGDIGRSLAGRRGQQRCRMVCGVDWADDDEAVGQAAGERWGHAG